MKLQLALDRLNKDQCFRILKETADQIQWIEIGTGVIKEYGMSIVREIKSAYSNKLIVADMKTCDAGEYEATQAFENGADISTVMAFSADQTIKNALMVAKQYDCRIMVDLLGIKDHERISILKSFGVDLVSLHLGKDMQQVGRSEKDLFSLINRISGVDVAIAGGVSLDTLPAFLEKHPQIIIVGGAITQQEYPRETAANMKEVIDGYERNHL